MDILKIVVTLSSTICNFRILVTWDMQTDLKKTKVMKAALSLRVKVMLTDHRYSCHGVLVVALLVAISLFQYICCQAGKHVRKKSSVRKTHGRMIEGSSKLSVSTDLMASQVKCNYSCQFVRYVCINVVILTVLFTCRVIIVVRL